MPASRQTPVRPRVLHCITHLALGGAERIAVTLMTALRDEFDFTVHAVRGVADGEVGAALGRELRALGIPVSRGLRVPMRFGGVITGALGLGRATRKAAPDLIHLHTEIPEASYAAMTVLHPRLRTIPLVRTIHNSVFWQFYRPLGRWCDRRMSHGHVAGVAAGAIDAFLGLQRESGAGAPPAPPELIYNAVRPPQQVRARHDRARGDPIRIVFGGRFEWEKGADLIPRIITQAPPPPGRRVHLTLHGSGRYGASLAALALAPPAGWTVEVRPPIPEFADQLSAFDLALIPSRHEGLCLVAIEAALAGVPAILTDARGLRETVPPGHPWCARAGDAGSFAALLRAAFDDPDRWDDIAAAAQASAQKRFNVTAMADAYRRLYHRALASRHKATDDRVRRDF